MLQTQRTVYVAHTNTGLEGLGEYAGQPADQEILDHYIGTSPFEHINDEVHLGLGTAMMDLMGKATGLPCHRLFGTQCRTYVPVSSWFNATSPQRMAEAVEYYAELGHTWMKFHLSPFENVLEQTKAMQAVAPAGFQIHYDFTMYGDQGGQGGLTHVAQLLEALSEFPIAGCYEDVLWYVRTAELASYPQLRLVAISYCTTHKAKACLALASECPLMHLVLDLTRPALTCIHAGSMTWSATRSYATAQTVRLGSTTSHWA